MIEAHSFFANKNTIRVCKLEAEVQDQGDGFSLDVNNLISGFKDTKEGISQA